MKEAVYHPDHYQSAHGVETIEIAEHLGFNLGNAYKYIDRAGKKDPSKYAEDLRKARWYIQREMARKEMPQPALPAHVNRLAMKVMSHSSFESPLCKMACVVRDWDGYGPRKNRLCDAIEAIDVALKEAEGR